MDNLYHSFMASTAGDKNTTGTTTTFGGSRRVPFTYDLSVTESIGYGHRPSPSLSPTSTHTLMSSPPLETGLGG